MYTPSRTNCLAPKILHPFRQLLGLTVERICTHYGSPKEVMTSNDVRTASRFQLNAPWIILTTCPSWVKSRKSAYSKWVKLLKVNTKWSAFMRIAPAGTSHPHFEQGMNEVKRKIYFCRFFSRKFSNVALVSSGALFD